VIRGVGREIERSDDDQVLAARGRIDRELEVRPRRAVAGGRDHLARPVGEGAEHGDAHVVVAGGGRDDVEGVGRGGRARQPQGIHAAAVLRGAGGGPPGHGGYAGGPGGGGGSEIRAPTWSVEATSQAVSSLPATVVETSSAASTSSVGASATQEIASGTNSRQVRRDMGLNSPSGA